MPDYPSISPFAYWDDDLDRQLAEYASGGSIAPHAPPVAPADEWNDGGGPTANAEAALADRAAVRGQVQDAADAALGPEGGAAFWKGTDRAAYYAANPDAKQAAERTAREHEYEQAMRKVQNAGVGTLGNARSGFVDGMLAKKYAMNPMGDRAYIAQATAPIGTIGQIGSDPALEAALKDAKPGSLSSDLAAASPADIDMGDSGDGAYVGSPIEFEPDYVGKPTIGYPRPIAADDELGGRDGHPAIPPGISDQIAGAPGAPIQAPAAPPARGQIQDPIGASVRAGLGLEPDVISGGMVPGQSAQPKDRGAPQESDNGLMTPDQFLSPWEVAQRQSKISPEDQAKIDIDHETARQKFAAAEAQKLADDQLREATENAKALRLAHRSAQEKSARLAARAEEISNTKIDPLADIGTTQKIAAVLASFIGGFAANSNGGRNVGLEAVDNLINRSIQAQTANLQNKRELLGRQQTAIADELAEGRDLYEAQEAIRLAAYGQLAKKLETDVQNYDPRGTQAQRYRHAIDQIRARQAESLAKFQDDDFARTEKLIKEAREQQKLAADIAHQRRQDKNDATRAGADWVRAKAEEKKAAAEAGTNALFSADQLRAQGVAIPQGVQLPAGGWSIKQAKAVAETAKSVEDWQKAARENSPESQTLEHGVENLTTEDGKPLKLKDSKKVTDMYAASMDAIRLYDELIALRRLKGGSTDLMRSPEWRQAHGKFAALLLNQKTVDQLGALTGSDMELEARKIGTSDPTEWRDPLPGLLEGRHNVIERLNVELRAQAPGQKPKRIEPPLPPEPAPETPDDRAFKDLKNWTARGARLSAPDEFGINRKDLVVDPGLLERAFAKNGGLTPSVRDRIDALRANALDASDEEKQKDAAAKLEDLAKHADSPAIRSYILSNAVNPAIGAQLSKD